MNRKSGPNRRVFALVNTKRRGTGFVPLATLLENWTCRRVNSRSAESMHTARSGTRRLARNNYRPFYSRVHMAGHSWSFNGPTIRARIQPANRVTLLTPAERVGPRNQVARTEVIVTISPSYPTFKTRGEGEDVVRALGPR